MCVYIYIYIYFWSGFNLLVFRAVWDCGVSGLSQSVTTLLLTRLVLSLALVLLLIVVVTSKSLIWVYSLQDSCKSPFAVSP